MVIPVVNVFPKTYKKRKNLKQQWLFTFTEGELKKIFLLNIFAQYLLNFTLKNALASLSRTNSIFN